MAPVVHVGLVQLATSEDPDENRRRTVQHVHQAARRGAQLVCLQELFASRYFCQVEDPTWFDLAESVPGPSTHALSEAARQLGIAIVVPVFERRAVGLYHNSCVVLGPDGAQLTLYRKMHVPDDPQYQEKFYFTPGDLGFRVCPTPFGRVGPLICWDQWYPEAARLVALRGAQILTYPTAIGWLPEEKASDGATQLRAWRTMHRSHAIANGVFVVAVNRVGFEPKPGGAFGEGIEFWGHSFVCDPQGVVLAEAGEGEEVLVVACDLGRSEAVRRWWPFFRDRRIDHYGGLMERWVGDEEVS